MSGILFFVVFNALECTADFVDKLLEHFPSCLLVKNEPPADDHHLYNDSHDAVEVEIVKEGQLVDLVPIEVVNASFSGENVVLLQNCLKLF